MVPGVQRPFHIALTGEEVDSILMSCDLAREFTGDMLENPHLSLNEKHQHEREIAHYDHLTIMFTALKDQGRLFVD